ncbi:hypothetical protein [Actinoalloteichus hymeniacidonis]|uniref:Uncharacterized protein n=1 Tax=Actinoalloteichus hymeniacidonis TaxID=340345 RepID=A0AAC9HSC3_9PSEU|nr:hypothetical protein [Actinoalloteichus hymeniacidonis]AOS64523.1 hypothetical protein TL08_18640 [Actinoalloteichus hymeniacidonis]MBB5907405.1 hypothetical protein [Actinoalloteichus hymeniacidonis]
MSAAPPNDPITDEQRGYAFLFVSALNRDKVLAGKWKDRLASIKPLSVPDRIKSLDNFLADHGYATRAEAVLGLLKSQWWLDYVGQRKPNADSDRFVQDILTDTRLYKEYGAQLAKAQAAKDLSVLNSWLTRKDYHCTAVQVDASFNAMRDKNMNYWTGIYGETLVQQGKDKSKTGPALLIYGNTSASLGPDMLFNVTYAKGVLSWQLGKEPEANPCAGQVTFGTITRTPIHPDDYVGNEFSGTLTYPTDSSADLSGAYSYAGRIGDPPPDEKGKLSTPPAVDKTELQKIADFISPIVIIGFGVALLGGFLKFCYKAKEWATDRAEKLQDKAEKDAEKSTDSLDPAADSPLDRSKYSDSTTVEQLQNDLKETGDPQRQEDLQQKIDETKAEEKAAEEQRAKDDERGEDADDLGDDGIDPADGFDFG